MIMTLDINENLEKLLLEITAIQYIEDSKLKTANMLITKDNINYLQQIGCWLPELVLEELIRELYECNTDEDYEKALDNLDDKEINELLLRLDVKFKNLWNE